MTKPPEALIQLRHHAGLSQYALATRMKKKRGWVAFVEQGRIHITPRDAKAWGLICARKLAPVVKKLVPHQVVTCASCSRTVYDDPPNSGLFPPCRCGTWK